MYSLKNVLAVLLLSIYTSLSIVQAQAPNWKVNTSEYQYTMTIVAFLNVNQTLLVEEKDKVAAFVDGKVRGVATPIYVPSANRYLAYLTVFANKENEKIEFKVYDSSHGNVVPIAATLSFKIDAQYGNVFQAVSLANPALNKDAVIKDFFFTNVDSISTTITEEGVDITVEYNQDLKNLNPEFMLSAGATMYRDRAMQKSGAATHDFFAPASYSVLSEDESVLHSYTVTVRNRQTMETGFVSTNVITANNDGVNDFWIVTDVFKYSNHAFKIFDVNGRLIFESIGYKNDWNGYYKNTRIARGKYYFIIKDPNTQSIIKGDILVLY